MDKNFGPYADVKALYLDAVKSFDEFDLDDITEDDHANVIVDTLVSMYRPDEFSGLANLGIDPEAEGIAEDDVEAANEVLEEKAEEIADALNDWVRENYPDEWRSFNFSWEDGGYYLFFGGDVNNQPDAEDDEDDE